MTDRQCVTGDVDQVTPENRVFYPALDGLRGIAFLMVFIWHYLHTSWGWAGVNIFFVLSGFLITGILFDTRNDPHRVRNFYMRRTLRIFPLYYGIFLVLLFSSPFMHWQWNWHWLVWPTYLGNLVPFLRPIVDGSGMQRLSDFQLYTKSHHFYTPLYFGHFWTLCVEEQFYLIWPWVVFWVRDRRKLIWISAASIPICLAARSFAGDVLPLWMIQNNVIEHATPFLVDDLLVGGLLALLMRGPERKALLRWSWPVTVAAFACVICWFAYAFAVHIPHGYPKCIQTFGFTYIAILTGLTILLAIQPQSWLSRILCWYPIRWLGRISYGAYVFHDIFHAFYNKVAYLLCAYLIRSHVAFIRFVATHPQAWATLIGFCATILLAYASFRFYESPFLKLKDRWTVCLG